MRKTVGFILIGLAGFLLTATVLALVYVPDQVKRTPLDTNSTTRLSGQAAVLPSGPGSPVKAVSRTVADGEASDDDVIVFDTFSCLVRDPDGTAPDCVDDTDAGSLLVTAGTDRFATDRRTAMAVNDEVYVGAAAEPHEGLVNKFPFDVQQETYPYWDGLVGRAVDAEFQADEEIDGLPVYKFLISLTDEPAEISNGVSGLYSTEKTLWIDQGTGKIIDQSEAQVRQLDDGTTVLDLELSFTDETVAANVEDAKASNSQLSLVRRAPIVLGLLGLLALAGGAYLVVPGSTAPRRDERQDVSLDELTSTRRAR
jgi:Porin PorA